MKKIKVSNTDDKTTTIKVLMSTRNEIAKLGNMDDNFDTVIRRLLKFYKENKKE
ncbi:MAG TPA: hypothetical protein VKA95_03090 [Nitrososphaeraceae archaeon]|nr:hypothetical protein [Nitrososphaeraceae archaeon]